MASNNDFNGEMVHSSNLDDLANFPGDKHALILALNIEERHWERIEMAIHAFEALGYSSIMLAHGGDKRRVSSQVPLEVISNCGYLDVYDSVTDHVEQFGRDDQVTIFLTGHGNRNGEAYIVAKDGSFSSKMFYSWVNRYLQTQPRLVVSSICHGFGFVREAVSRESHFGITASDNHGTSYHGSVFMPHFLEVLAQQGNVRQAFMHAYNAHLDAQQTGMQQPAFVDYDTRFDNGHHFAPMWHYDRKFPTEPVQAKL